MTSVGRLHRPLVHSRRVCRPKPLFGTAAGSPSIRKPHGSKAHVGKVGRFEAEDVIEKGQRPCQVVYVHEWRNLDEVAHAQIPPATALLQGRHGPPPSIAQGRTGGAT